MALDRETLERGLALLPPELQTAFADALEPPWRARQRRLDLRDAALRQAAAELFAALGVTARARAVSRTLDRHIAGRDVQHAVLFSRIAILNAHRGLSARQVFDVLQGDRSIMRKSGSETA